MLVFVFNAVLYAAPKPYTYYEITKVKDYRGLNATKELINSICLNRIIYYGSMRYDFSFRPYSPGTAVTSMGQSKATFFDMYDENTLTIPNEVNYTIPIMATKWGKDSLHWFSYRSSSDYFSPKFGTIVCETRINGKSGEITFRTKNNRSITFSVKECKDSNRKTMLDIKGIWEDLYPFSYKKFTVDGIIEYKRPQGTRNIQWVNEKEQVSIDLIISDNNKCYILGFKCIKQDRSTGISLSKRDAGLSEAKPVRLSKQSVICLPVKGDRVGFANARSVLLSFDLSGINFSSVKGEFMPYPYIYSHEVITGDSK